MTDITKLTPDEKSVMLALVADVPGLFVRHVKGDYPTASLHEPITEAYDTVCYKKNGRVYHGVNLYDEDWMALAAEGKQWALLNPKMSHLLTEWASAMTSITGDNHTRHAPRWWILEASGKGQAAWLDKILELAIEAGMVDTG